MQLTKIVMLDRAQSQKKCDASTGGFSAQEKAGLLPTPVRLSVKRVGWIEAELDDVLAARAAGWNDDEVRQLVRGLIADRTARVAELTRHLSEEPNAKPALARARPASLSRRSSVTAPNRA